MSDLLRLRAVYVQPICPQPNLMWTPGYWAYSNDEWGLLLGARHVGARTLFGALWTPPYWGWNGGRYGFHDGYWGRHVGYYGGVDYGFGFGGIGFAGGEWRGNSFAYNTAVVHVNETYCTSPIRIRQSCKPASWPTRIMWHITAARAEFNMRRRPLNRLQHTIRTRLPLRPRRISRPRHRLIELLLRRPMEAIRRTWLSPDRRMPLRLRRLLRRLRFSSTLRPPLMPRLQPQGLKLGRRCKRSAALRESSTLRLRLMLRPQPQGLKLGRRCKQSEALRESALHQRLTLHPKRMPHQLGKRCLSNVRHRNLVQSQPNVQRLCNVHSPRSVRRPRNAQRRCNMHNQPSVRHLYNTRNQPSVRLPRNVRRLHNIRSLLNAQRRRNTQHQLQEKRREKNQSPRKNRAAA